MPEREIRFPDINEAFIGAKTLGKACKNYERLLRSQGDIDCVLYANKIEQFRSMTLLTKLRELENEFQELKERVRELGRQKNISILLSRRRKDFIGLNEKIRLFLKKGYSLERILDFLGFRLVILSDEVDTQESIQLCYAVFNEIIKFFVVERGCLITEAEPVLDTGFSQEEHPEIYIPSESLVLEGFEHNVKDYVRTPKRNGYQSLHCVFRKTDGIIFEVQVRTMGMNITAEYGSACHKPYKVSKYTEEPIELDYSKIHIPGFIVLPNGEIVDKIGLVKSVDPFNLLMN